MAKNVFSDSKCKYEAYDKDEMETTFLKNANIAVVKTEKTATSSMKTFTAVLPAGFNRDNCVLINWKLYTYDVDDNIYNITHYYGVSDNVGTALNNYFYTYNSSDQAIISMYYNRSLNEVEEGQKDQMVFYLLKMEDE